MILACQRIVLLSSLHKSNNLLKNILYKSFKDQAFGSFLFLPLLPQLFTFCSLNTTRGSTRSPWQDYKRGR